ncbi:MAG: hypothetical protein PHN68_10415 [Prolixibacteraceae bacterium]|nr:hypothetical protein [Prolixibacteraceae bacterium]MDD4756044.1 hypothetical protein [Prolixibacteraceae bacterium]
MVKYKANKKFAKIGLASTKRSYLNENFYFYEMINTMGVKVTLRRKPISEQRENLFLGFYPVISHSKTGKNQINNY